MAPRPCRTANRGCQCDRCTAHRKYNREQKRRRYDPVSRVERDLIPGMTQDGQLTVECWCRNTIITVPPHIIRACLTDTCGLPWCHPPKGAA